MTKQERKVILIIVGIMIGILLIVRGVSKKEKNLGETNIQEEQNKQNEEKYVTTLNDGTKLNNSGEFNKSKKYKDIEISNIQFTYESGRTVLLADVKNTAGTKHTSEIVKLTILDENNEIIDEVNAIMPNIEAGETKKLNTIITGADRVNAKDFKIEEKK